MTRLALLGGSFDPPHLGHLHLARAAHAQRGLDEVRLVPAARSPLKQGPVAARGDHRLDLCHALAAEEDWLRVDDRELRRGGTSYTIDTVLEVLAEHPGTERLDFLIGSDLLSTLPRWHRAAELAQRVRFVVAARDQPLEAPPGFEVHSLDRPPRELSSTEIRRRIAADQPFAHLLPAAILDRIREGAMYGASAPRVRTDLLATLFPDSVLSTVEEVNEQARGLPEERALVEQASDKRRHEFLSVRDAARRLLSHWQQAPEPVLPGPRGAPGWPTGIVGSLSHSRGLCAAAVARTQDHTALGLDLELLRPLNPALLRRILTPREIEELGPNPGIDRDLQALVHFSAKECFYKCQFPRTGLFLGFQDARIERLEGQRFAVHPQGELPGWPSTPVVGHWSCFEDWVATGMVLEA